MPFWKSGKGEAEQVGSAGTGQAQKAKRTVKRSPTVALEVELLAMEALQSNLSLGDVAEIIGGTAGVDQIKLTPGYALRSKSPTSPRSLL
jgi:hypothetical protein